MVTYLKTVERIYEAFGRGDIATILDCLSDDVRWEAFADNTAQAAGVPWLQPRQGKAGVGEFFRVVGAWKIRNFQVLSLMAGGHQVSAEIVLEAEVAPDGARLADEELHLWTFDSSGKVVRFRHYVDTAKHIRAAGLDPAGAAANRIA